MNNIEIEYIQGLMNRLGQKLDDCFGYGEEDIEELLDEWKNFVLNSNTPVKHGCVVPEPLNDYTEYAQGFNDCRSQVLESKTGENR